MAKSKRRQALEAEYRRLAKRADQRLVRLEQAAAGKPGYESVLQYSYRKAQRNIRAWSGTKPDGRPGRFNTKAPADTNQLKAKIRDIKEFLSSASSTIGATKETKGIEGIYKQRADTLNEKYGTDFTWQDLAKFFESGLNEKLSNQYASDSKMEIIASLQANKEQIEAAIKSGSEVHIQTDDDVLEFMINEVIGEYGSDILKALS